VLGNFHWREVVGTISDVMLGEFEIEEILMTPGMDKLHVVAAGAKPLTRPRSSAPPAFANS